MGLFIPPRPPPSRWQAICPLSTPNHNLLEFLFEPWSFQANTPGSKPCGQHQKSTYAQKFEKSVVVPYLLSSHTNSSCRYHLPVHTFITFFVFSFFLFLKSRARAEQSKAHGIRRGKKSGDRITTLLFLIIILLGFFFFWRWWVSQSSRLARGCGGGNQSICAAQETRLASESSLCFWSLRLAWRGGGA